MSARLRWGGADVVLDDGMIVKKTGKRLAKSTAENEGFRIIFEYRVK
jgi:hypothetical protein